VKVVATINKLDMPDGKLLLIGIDHDDYEYLAILCEDGDDKVYESHYTESEVLYRIMDRWGNWNTFIWVKDDYEGE
jgi:putative IMPACT (imprinted ancient) family translation regulator